MSFENTNNQAQHEQNAADSTHAPILSGAQQLALREAEFRTLMAKRTDPSVDLFYEKLRMRLKMVGIDYDKLDFKTDMVAPPPCFTWNKTSFEEWLRYASIGSIPLRMDMPGEPNYCNDCTPEFKLKMERKEQCMFPRTRFEVRKESGEPATAGVSRSVSAPPSDYVVYQEMTVPLESLERKLRDYVRGSGKGRFRLTDTPQDVSESYARINWGGGEGRTA